MRDILSDYMYGNKSGFDKQTQIHNKNNKSLK